MREIARELIALLNQLPDELPVPMDDATKELYKQFLASYRVFWAAMQQNNFIDRKYMLALRAGVEAPIGELTLAQVKTDLTIVGRVNYRQGNLMPTYSGIGRGKLSDLLQRYLDLTEGE